MNKKKSKTLQMRGRRDGQITKSTHTRSQQNIASSHSNTCKLSHPYLITTVQNGFS